tara:strand:- start:8076 stop:9050 length:975 start_codon:yes stop_codon:yes gene_type:complete
LKIAESLKNKILKYAQEFNRELISIEPLKIEASGRKYFRVFSENLSFVISFDDRPINGQLVFIKRAEEFAASDVRVPKIFDYDKAKYLTILEDLGDHSLINENNFYENDSLVLSSLKLLNKMHQSIHRDLHSTFWMGLESHTKKFSKIFCKNFLKIKMFKEYEDIFPDLRSEILNQQWTNCHFDFERRNIHVLKNTELALLDFQDLCHGPIGIDLAGILIDHYIPLNLETLKKYCESFSKISIYEISPDETYKAALWGGLQRNLRIMGTLTELHINLKRSFRMNDLPQIVSNTAELSMELNQVQLANFLQDNVSQALEKELLKI